VNRKLKIKQIGKWYKKQNKRWNKNFCTPRKRKWFWVCG